MNTAEKINAINAVLREFFDNPLNPRRVKAKDLMDCFIKQGIFIANYRDGLPIRKLLRELDEAGKLNLIPFVCAERKNKNTNWYFVACNSLKLERFSEKYQKKNAGRSASDEYYVVQLCNEVLGKKASQQHRFDFLRGDTGVKLPVDAYYKELNLVVEYYESQHCEDTPFFDRKITASGISRGEQRKVYDQRRVDELSKRGIKLVIIRYSDFGTTRRIARNYEKDIAVVKRLLSK